MRPAFPLIIAALFAALLALPACTSREGPSQLTGLPPVSVTLDSTVVKRDIVRLVWSVRDADGRQFEFLRQNRAEPWKLFATVQPVEGRVTLVDTGVVPGQRYLYRLRVQGMTGDAYLDEVDVVVPL